MKVIILFALLGLLPLNCAAPEAGTASKAPAAPSAEPPIRTGAERTEAYLPVLLQAEGVGLVVNPTSRIGSTHLVDSLLSAGVRVQRIFAPEHGFRGEADAGATVADGKDTDTGLPVSSLYGKNKKPRSEQLAGLDLVVFDIQDVGARFYTYISTMHYVMEACAENDVRFVVLDRPNPNGHYIDGPLLDPAFQSFVGMHPVPVVHGMTVGEYARMINGEGWISRPAELQVIPCANYERSRPYELPVRPSPNLPNQRSVYLYPSLCFFEGTVVSAGRGTAYPFQQYGYPGSEYGPHTFLPASMAGARYPKHEGRECRGFALTGIPLDSLRAQARLDLSHLIGFYRNFPDPGNFFLENRFFDKLAGTDALRRQITEGWDEARIRESWAEGLAAFRKIRAPYLIYE